MQGILRNLILLFLTTTVAAAQSSGDGRPQMDAFAVQSAPLTSPVPGPVRTDSTCGLVMHRPVATRDFIDLAGRRCLAMGVERGGLDELWVHPFRLLRGFDAAIVDGGRLTRLRDLPCSVEVRPELLLRRYRTARGTLTETILVAHARPGLLVQYRFSGPRPPHIVVAARSDLRMMWPREPGALGALRTCFDHGLRAFHIRGAGDSVAALLGSAAAPVRVLHGRGDSLLWRNGAPALRESSDGGVMCVAEYAPVAGRDAALSIAIAGSSHGVQEAEEVYRTLLADPQAAFDEVAAHHRDLLARVTTITSPDRDFDELYRWAVVGADRFVATTPGLGTALLAGFGPSTRGWDGGQRPSGRPGYAWYFGRDAAWAGFALDAVGELATVRAQLRFFAEHQGEDGRIFHELTTSGVPYFTSADATPLFIMLAAHHLRASNDHVFADSLWPAIRRAIDFLSTTDSDGDGLIENHDVGHGWIEGGSLAGARTELYLAALWLQCLRDAEYLSAKLRHVVKEHDLVGDAERVRVRFEERFWQGPTGLPAHAIMPDGGMNTELTALAAVPIALGLADSAQAAPALQRFASNGFTTDWGVRLIDRTSQHYSPDGYHEGSVWPLFTGWTGLAEFQAGNSAQAFAHLRGTMEIARHWALGAVEEVMHGDRCEPAGVCPRQCWSETMVLQPAIEGMVGWKPDAASEIATLRPRFPAHWNHVLVRNLRAGRTVLDLEMQRTTTSTEYRLTVVDGPPIMIHLHPELADGLRITRVRMNTVPVLINSARERGALREPIPFYIRKQAVIAMEHTGGFAMLPTWSTLREGRDATGCRIVSQRQIPAATAADSASTVSTHQVLLEAPPGTVHSFSAMVYDGRIVAIDGATATKPDARGLVNLRVRFDATGRREVLVSTAAQRPAAPRSSCPRRRASMSGR